MIFKPGALYNCTYLNWHNDKYPLLFVLYSDSKYTIGLNAHYIDKKEYEKLVSLFKQIVTDPMTRRLFKKEPREFYYEVLKKHFKEFIDVSYRMYFSNQLLGMVAHPILYARIGEKVKDREAIRKARVITALKNQRSDSSTKLLKSLLPDYRRTSSTLKSVNDMKALWKRKK